MGVIAQFGGQTPLNLAADLKKNGVNILGTTPETIDLAEDRDLFRAMMEKLEIPMPESGMAVTTEDALEIAGRIGYPVMVRPSYVLGGRGMEGCVRQRELDLLYEGGGRCYPPTVPSSSTVSCIMLPSVRPMLSATARMYLCPL